MLEPKWLRPFGHDGGDDDDDDDGGDDVKAGRERKGT